MTLPGGGGGGDDDSTPLYNEQLAEFNKEAHIDTGCRIHLAQLGDTLVLSIVGSANRAGYQFLAAKALAIINGERKKALIIDLSLCDRLGSSPLGMIGLVIMAFNNRGGQVHVITADESIIRALALIRVDGLCRIVASADRIPMA